MHTPSIYLNFAGNTEAAFDFYRDIFGGEYLGVVRYRDFPVTEQPLPEAERDKIAHIALPLADGCLLMGTDLLDSLDQNLTVGNNVTIALEAESVDEAERLFTALSAGGKIEMPLSEAEWAEKFGQCTDQFGIQWMVSYTGSVQFQPQES